MTDQAPGGERGPDGGRTGPGGGQGGRGGQGGKPQRQVQGDQPAPRAGNSGPAPSQPAAAPTEVGLDSPLLQHLLARIEAQVVEVVRRELPAALLPASALRESLDAALPLLTELNRRVGRLETQVSGTETAIVDKVLAALVQVTQHLEALQTATAWATLGELTRPQ